MKVYMLTEDDFERLTLLVEKIETQWELEWRTTPRDEMTLNAQDITRKYRYQLFTWVAGVQANK